MFLKRLRVQCFGKDIRVLFSRLDISQADDAAVDGVPNDVVFDVDVPCPPAAETVVCHFNGSLIVLVKKDPGVSGWCHKIFHLS